MQNVRTNLANIYPKHQGQAKETIHLKHAPAQSNKVIIVDMNYLCKDKKSFLILFKNSVKLLILSILNIVMPAIVLSFKINSLNLCTDKGT